MPLRPALATRPAGGGGQASAKEKDPEPSTNVTCPTLRVQARPRLYLAKLLSLPTKGEGALTATRVTCMSANTGLWEVSRNKDKALLAVSTQSLQHLHPGRFSPQT